MATELLDDWGMIPQRDPLPDILPGAASACDLIPSDYFAGTMEWHDVIPIPDITSADGLLGTDPSDPDEIFLFQSAHLFTDLTPRDRGDRYMQTRYSDAERALMQREVLIRRWLFRPRR